MPPRYSPADRTPLLARPPALFELARGMVRRRMWGGYHLIELLEWLGWLDCRAIYRLSDRVSIEVPLWRRPNQLNTYEASCYEAPLVGAVTAEVRQIGRPAVLVDCGADIGLVTGLLVAHNPLIGEVVAIEPNTEAGALLACNLERLPVPSRRVATAVADYRGRGRLVRPEYGKSPHAEYVAPDAAGAYEVVRIDDLAIDAVGRCLIVKLDIEGGELAAVRGAIATLANSRRFVVTIEAHRDVTARSGVDPLDVVRLLDTVRPTRVYLAEYPDRRIDRSGRLFEHGDAPPIGNLVCVDAEG